MKLFDKEYYEVLEYFEKNYACRRLDLEIDKELWKTGQVFECGETNELFKAYLFGYGFGKVNS